MSVARAGEPFTASTKEADSTVTPEIVAQIVRLYSEFGLSTYRIAEQVKLDRQRIVRILRREGVTIAARGSGRPRPLKVVDGLSEETLRSLYIDHWMSSIEIGRTLGISDRTVRSRLALWGIERRTRGSFDRHDRTDVTPEELDRLYVDKELAASEVGEELGVSGRVVLQAGHSHGVPVRAGGSPRPSKIFDIQLIEVLYDDVDVRQILTAHGIPIVREPGPIWQRFLNPKPLTGELVKALYVECGLACFHIELLTGHPVPTVLRRLDALGIARRGQGGRSPFMQRWHAQQRATAPTSSSDCKQNQGHID
ncbi:MAG: hypothetical protein EPN30_11145 [Actinomycetota bacterium]|nr:MAG: hypothetical protein EPN30_11145 [Actinomycetota bacterium]